MRSQVRAYTAAVAIALMASLAHGQEPSPAYTPPRGKKMFFPAMPDWVPKDRQFWVLVTFMVDRDGKAYEAAAVDSNGPEALEKSAVKNLDRAQFRPATFDNRTVDSAHRMNYSFMTDGLEPFSAEFEDSYNSISSAVARGERQLADELLAAIKVRSLNEDASRNMLLHLYHKRWGTPAQQVAVLRRASGIRDPNVYIQSQIMGKVLRPRLELEIQLNDFGGALTTWDIIERSKKTQEFAPTFQATIDDIRARVTDDRSHTVAGEVDHRGSWFVQLLKRKFSIEVPNGKVSRLKLRCQRGFFKYELEAGEQYETDENAGPCQLQVIGEPGTALELRQS